MTGAGRVPRGSCWPVSACDGGLADFLLILSKFKDPRTVQVVTGLVTRPARSLAWQAVEKRGWKRDQCITTARQLDTRYPAPLKRG